MHLTPAMLETAYEFLRTLPPFRGWNLPEADQVEFHVLRTVDRAGDHYIEDDGRHVIRVSGGRIGSPVALLALLSHELCHMRQRIRYPRDKAEHGATFNRLAAQVCRNLLLDAKAF